MSEKTNYDSGIDAIQLPKPAITNNNNNDKLLASSVNCSFTYGNTESHDSNIQKMDAHKRVDSRQIGCNSMALLESTRNEHPMPADQTTTSTSRFIQMGGTVRLLEDPPDNKAAQEFISLREGRGVQREGGAKDVESSHLSVEKYFGDDKMIQCTKISSHALPVAREEKQFEKPQELLCDLMKKKKKKKNLLVKGQEFLEACQPEYRAQISKLNDPWSYMKDRAQKMRDLLTQMLLNSKMLRMSFFLGFCFSCVAGNVVLNTTQNIIYEGDSVILTCYINTGNKDWLTVFYYRNWEEIASCQSRKEEKYCTYVENLHGNYRSIYDKNPKLLITNVSKEDNGVIFSCQWKSETASTKFHVRARPKPNKPEEGNRVLVWIIIGVLGFFAISGAVYCYCSRGVMVKIPGRLWRCFKGLTICGAQNPKNASATKEQLQDCSLDTSHGKDSLSPFLR